MSNWILIGPLVGIVLITAGLVLGLMIFPPMVKERIAESVQIKRDTEQYDRWKEIPQPVDFKVYIFNVTNVEEIQRGFQPRVEEIGPYVYTQNRRKYGIRFSRDNEHVSYYQQMHFEFDAEKSYPYTQNDPITVLSMHLNSFLQTLDTSSRQMISNVTHGVERTLDRIPIVNIFKRMLDRYTPIKSILQAVEAETPFLVGLVAPELHNIFGPEAKKSMFIKTTPRHLLFDGIEFCRDPTSVAQIVCMSIEDRKLDTITKTDDGRAMKFSLFGHKNKTNDGLYEINTGIRRSDKLLKIEKWNNGKTLKAWKKDSNGAPSGCQFINGTDSTSAGPFRQEGDNFYIFSSDICRSVQLFYEKKIVYDGIPGFRYKIGNNFLNELDDCFCTDRIKGTLKHDDGCLYSGAIDLYDCLEASIVGTLPHFYGADEKYQRLIDGIYPDENKHIITMDVEPLTGTPLRGGKKLQLNMFLRQIDQIPITQNFGAPILFPVIWLDEGLELNEQMTGMIKKDLINVLLYLDIVQWTLVGVGVAMIVGMLIWYYIVRKRMLKTTSTEVITDRSTTS